MPCPGHQEEEKNVRERRGGKARGRGGDEVQGKVGTTGCGSEYSGRDMKQTPKPKSWLRHWYSISFYLISPDMTTCQQISNDVNLTQAGQPPYVNNLFDSFLVSDERKLSQTWFKHQNIVCNIMVMVNQKIDLAPLIIG